MATSKNASRGRLGDIVVRHKPDLPAFEASYRAIHQHPELSSKESETANRVANFLADLDLDVVHHIGGAGVAGVLRNGEGNTVLLRAELDGLPIKEATGLSYASTRRMTDSWGRSQPTMHACGHDLHMACLMAATRLLRDAKSEWTGTLVVVFQPNEEHLGGAEAMVDGGLYDHVPVPDIALAQHTLPFKAGTVNISGGPVLVSADTMRIRLFSSLGYAANPQVNIDPIRLTSKIVLQLDDLAKAVAGEEFAQVRLEEIHAGYPGQDWVSHVDLTLVVKAYNPVIRQRLLEHISDSVKRESTAAGVKKPPEIELSVRAPLTNNSHEHAAVIHDSFVQFFGEDRVGTDIPGYAYEDFSWLATSHGRPYVFWFFGLVEPQQFDDAVRSDTFLDTVPINHSPLYAPDLPVSLEVGTEAMALAALSFLDNGK